MNRIAPLQVQNLLKSFALMLFGLSALWTLISLLVFGDVFLSQFILALNPVLAGILGWFFYRYRYHTVFTYDGEGFTLQRGALHLKEAWRNFSSVSLVHLGRGNFAVRLYRSGEGEGGVVDLPASDLKLDPSALRLEIMERVAGTSGETRSP